MIWYASNYIPPTAFWSPDFIEGDLRNQPCPSVLPSGNILKSDRSIFLKFCMMVDTHKGQILSKAFFRENSGCCPRAQKRVKNGQKCPKMGKNDHFQDITFFWIVEFSWKFLKTWHLIKHILKCASCCWENSVWSSRGVFRGQKNLVFKLAPHAVHYLKWIV